MGLRISGKNMDVGEALRSKATAHFDALVKKYFDGGCTGHVTLEPEGSGFSALCLLHLDTGVVLQSNAYGGDAVSAYELIAEAMEKRLGRYSRKLKKRRRHADGGATETQTDVPALPDRSDGKTGDGFVPAVIAEAASNLKQMSVGEAVMELDLMQAEIVMFRRAGHGGLNVVYRRADGNIGWIDPALRAN